MALSQLFRWLTTSRSYRILEQQNQQLIAERDQLREMNHKLMLAFSPSLKAAMEGTPQILSPSAEVPPTDALRTPLRSFTSWRTARTRLQEKHNSNNRRIQKSLEAHGKLP
jgi:hypothetical protein